MALQNWNISRRASSVSVSIVAGPMSSSAFVATVQAETAYVGLVLGDVGNALSLPSMSLLGLHSKTRT